MTASFARPDRCDSLLRRSRRVFCSLLLLCVARFVAAAHGSVYVFSHFAGSGGRAAVDGPAADARFDSPHGVAVDAVENVYVADTKNHTIRRIDHDGVVTTWVGLAGKSGSADGTANTARFDAPGGVAVDLDGNVYVADTGNHTIRKITPSREVTTFAGMAGAEGSENGDGAAARFRSPEGIATDSAGNVYVADWKNYMIRKISPQGAVTTLAGAFQIDDIANIGVYPHHVPQAADGVGAAALFVGPHALTLDAAGNIYVADSYTSIGSHAQPLESSGLIRKITPEGVVTTLAGSTGVYGSNDGAGTTALFYHPGGIAVDHTGNLYIADTLNDTIRRITPQSVVSTIAGAVRETGKRDGSGTVARFDSPFGLSIDSSGALFIADSNNNNVRRLATDASVTTYAGRSAAPGDDGERATASFNSPSGVVFDAAGNLYVADWANCTIRKISPTGEVTTLAGVAGVPGTADGLGAEARFSGPTAITADSADNLYVSDTPLTGGSAVRKITPAGVVTTLAGDLTSRGSVDGVGTAARFGRARGIGVDATGNVFVADESNHTVRKITPDRLVTTFAGAAGTSGSVDGVGSAARLSYPYALVVDAAGNLYVSGGGIRKISPDGNVTTVTTQGNYRALALDADGRLFASDPWAIYRISPTGVAQAIGGGLVLDRADDGTGGVASFNSPSGLAFDQLGNLYIADSGNNAIRKGVPAVASQLVNLSTRAFVGPGDNIPIAGFVVTGTTPKQVLLRTMGPTLGTHFNIPGVLPDPVLILFDSAGTALYENRGWGDDPGILNAANLTGAIAWPSNSKDAALLVTLPPGAYTAHIRSQSGKTGTVLLEAYDADPDSPARLINLSTRATAGTDSNIVIAGFVISGSQPKQVLIRATGPTMSAFHLSEPLPDPTLVLFDQTGSALERNTRWSTSLGLRVQLIQQTAAAVGAFKWETASADSALIVTLPPGVYTAQVRGDSGDAGLALIEIYDADPP